MTDSTQSAALDPASLVHELFRRFRAADPTVADLYAEDGVLAERGVRYEGRETIADFYRGVFEVKPQPHVEALFINLPTVAAYLRVELPGGASTRTIDVLTVGDGVILSNVICMADNAP